MEDRFAAFKHKAFTLYFSSRFCTSLATQIVSVAVGWQIYDQTQNPALLGWIGLVQFLPALLLVAVTGITADRVGRRIVMACAVIIEMLCAGAIFYLAVTNNFNPVWVLFILTLFGIARAFYSPASSSLVVNIVPPNDFPNAVGWSTSSWQLAAILYGISGPVAYGVAASFFLLAAILIVSISKPKQKRETAPTTIKTLLGGFQYIWNEKIVLGAISLDLFAVLLGGAVALLPIYARDILELGPMGLGLLRAAPGIGAIITIIWLTAFPIRDHVGILLFICVGLFGLATLIFGFSTISWLSIFALMLIGAFDMVSVYIREILLQLWTPDHVRGRVNAVNSIFIGASNELGEFRAGFMAAMTSAVFAVTAGGAAAIGVAMIFSRLFPKLRQVRYLRTRSQKRDKT